MDNYKRTVVNRLSRTIGHLTSVKNMIEDERDFRDILVQSAAVRAEINSISKLILTEYLERCVDEASRSGDIESLEAVKKEIARLI